MGRLGSTPADGCAPLGEHLLGAWVIFAEGLSLGDVAARAWGAYRSVGDGLTLSDSKLLGEILMGEILGVPDMAFVVGKVPADGLALSDGLAHAWAAIRSAEDGVALSDARATAIGQALVDGLAIGDAEALLLALALTLYARSGDLTLPERGG